MDTPNITSPRQVVFFDILCEHSPPGTEPGDNMEGVLKVQAWVKQIAAYDPEEAGRKAERFLTETRGVRNIKVVRWRYTSRQRREGHPDGTLFT